MDNKIDKTKLDTNSTTDERNDSLLKKADVDFVGVLANSASLLTNSGPQEVFDLVLSTYNKYLDTIIEVETTKRREIEAHEKETLEKIKAQRDILITYLDRSFDERKGNFEKLFSMLDDAIENGNREVFSGTIQSITALGKSSPFADIKNLLGNPDAPEIEF